MKVRDSSLGSADIQQQLTLEPAQTGETESVPAEQQLQQQQLGPIGDSCPVLNTLPPLTECEGRKSNGWSPGVRDLDCLDSALCCFDGCANVCLGKGAKSGNGLTAEKKEPSRAITSSQLLQPLIKSPTKVDLQTESKAQQQDQRQPLVQVQSKPESSPRFSLPSLLHDPLQLTTGSSTQSPFLPMIGSHGGLSQLPIQARLTRSSLFLPTKKQLKRTLNVPTM